MLALFYVAGVYLFPRPTFLAILAGILVLTALFEAARLKNPAFAGVVYMLAGPLFREEERQKPTGVLWMLLGVITAAFLIQSTKVVATIYLFVVFGDGAASLVGKGIGGPKWPGSPKSMSGSAACFLVCLLIAGLMLRPTFAWPGLILVAATAAVLEFGFFRLNDNFAIPLGCALVLKWVYQLP